MNCVWNHRLRYDVLSIILFIVSNTDEKEKSPFKYRDDLMFEYGKANI